MFCTEFTLRLSSKQMTLESRAVPLSSLQSAFSNTGSQKMELELWFSNCNQNKIQYFKRLHVCFSGYFTESHRSTWNTKGWRQQSWEYLTEAGMIHFHKNNKYGEDLDRQLIIAQLHAMDQKLDPLVLFLCTITTTRSTTSTTYSFFIHCMSAKAPRFLFP